MELERMFFFDKRTKVTTLFVGLFIVISLFFFYACKNEEQQGGTVVLGQLTGPDGFHPLIDRSVGADQQLLFNGLLKLDVSLQPVPDLAQGWTVSEDGLVWDFTLKKGVQFHDGHEFSGEDVVFTLMELLQNPSKYSVAPLFGIVKSVSLLDDRNVRIVLRQAYAPILHLLTVEILPAHILQSSDSAAEQFRTNPIGTGPFVLSDWKDDTIVYDAFDDYFEGRPHLDSVVVKIFADKRRSWSALLQGSVDVVVDMNQEDYGVIENDDRFTKYSYLDFFYYTLLLQLEDPALESAAIRKAIDYAVNRQEIVKDSLGGWADTTSGPFLPGTWAYDTEIAATQFSADKALLLLQAEGWSDSNNDSILDRDGTDFTLSLLVDQGDVLKESVAQKIKWQLLQIGIKVEVEFLDLRELFQERLYPGLFQMALLQFNGVGDPDSFVSLFWHSGQIGASNLARYASPEVDRLIEQGRSTYEPADRKGIYLKIHRKIFDDTAAIFLFVRRVFGAADSKVEGIQPNPQVFFQTARNWRLRDN